MFERFTDRARRVLVLAQEQAKKLNHNCIGTEHLLLGLLLEREGYAAKALEAMEFDLEYLYAQIEEMIRHDSGSISGSPPFTPNAKISLENAYREALRLNKNYIGTEHLLLGIVDVGKGAAVEILIKKIGHLDIVRVAVLSEIPIEEIEEEPAEPLPDDLLELLVRREDVEDFLGWLAGFGQFIPEGTPGYVLYTELKKIVARPTSAPSP